MRKLYFLLVILFFSCNTNNSIPKEENINVESDSVLIKNRNNLAESILIQYRSDSATQKTVIRIITKIQYLTKEVVKYKTISEELKADLDNKISVDTVKILNRDTVYLEKVKKDTVYITVPKVIYDTIYIEKKNSFKPYWDHGFFVGKSDFLGDLDDNTQATNFMGGLFLSYYPKNWLGLRIAGNIGKLSGNDFYVIGNTESDLARKNRNLNFRTMLYETYVASEIYPYDLLFKNNKNTFFNVVKPYGIIGLGIFNFNPQGYDFETNQWVDLKPLRTEGQGFLQYPDRKVYNLTQFNIPYGFGIKSMYNDRVYLGIEVLYRKTFTDYIDDVSTRYINPKYFYQYLPENQAYLAQRMANKSHYYYTDDLRGNIKKDGYFTVSTRLGFKIK